jgi:hypothetical protein
VALLQYMQANNLAPTYLSLGNELTDNLRPEQVMRMMLMRRRRMMMMMMIVTKIRPSSTGVE